MKNTLLAITAAGVLSGSPVYAGSASSTQELRVRANVNQVMNEVPIPTVKDDSIIVFQPMVVNATHSLHPDHKTLVPMPMTADSSPTLILASSPTMSDGVQNLLESHRTALQGILGGGLLLGIGVFGHKRLRRFRSNAIDVASDDFLESRPAGGEILGVGTRKNQEIDNLLEERNFKQAYEIIQGYCPQDNASDHQESGVLPRQEAIDLLRKILENGFSHQQVQKDLVLEYYHSLGGEGNPEPKNEDAEGDENFQDSGIDPDTIGDINYFEEAKVSFSLNQHGIGLGQLKKYFSKLNSDNKVELKKVKKLLNKTQLEGENEIKKLELLALIGVKLGNSIDLDIDNLVGENPNRVSGRAFDFGDSLIGEIRPLRAPGDVISISDKREELLLSLTTGGEWDRYLFNRFIEEGDGFSDDDKIATCNYLITEIIKVDVNVLEFIGAINGIANQELRDKISRAIIRHNKEIGIKKKRLIKKVSFLRKPIIAKLTDFVLNK